ncbi:NnrU family protein [uncultured Sulfitobacter sp.]|uniref:NnrU family protein n=1 Tax=uncultured Sulfitobacter sp. TaxID=191468 RepID=UPI00262CC3F0|nr:NnrU family protein [uncultured Sulfitobacter sp.]
MAWFGFALAFVFFFASHSIPVRPPVKSWLVARLGQAGFTTCCAALSLLVLGWLIHAAHAAPFVALWAWPPLAQPCAIGRDAAGLSDRDHVPRPSKPVFLRWQPECAI